MRVGRAPTDRFQSIIDMDLRPYTIYRQRDTATNQYGSGPDDSQYTSDHTEELYCYFPDDNETFVEQGSVIRGSLEAYALPSADVEHGDRIDHGGIHWEVETTDPVPHANDPTVIEIRLTRVSESATEDDPISSGYSGNEYGSTDYGE